MFLSSFGLWQYKALGAPETRNRIGTKQKEKQNIMRKLKLGLIFIAADLAEYLLCRFVIQIKPAVGLCTVIGAVLILMDIIEKFEKNN